MSLNVLFRSTWKGHRARGEGAQQQAAQRLPLCETMTMFQMWKRLTLNSDAQPFGAQSSSGEQRDD